MMRVMRAAADAEPRPDLRGLIVDYGGVLTSSLEDTMSRWARADGIDYAEFTALMRRWLAADSTGNPVHELETGRLPVEEFERLVAAALRRPDGPEIVPAGLVQRMMRGFQPVQAMVGLVAAAKASGIRTALLSNSWGLDYPREGWAELFDAVVISGEVNMRKPEPAIFRHTAALLQLDPGQCVFVDDLAPNVRGAAAAGMVGVQHTDPDTTRQELESLFGRAFR